MPAKPWAEPMGYAQPSSRRQAAAVPQAAPLTRTASLCARLPLPMLCSRVAGHASRAALLRAGRGAAARGHCSHPAALH